MGVVRSPLWEVCRTEGARFIETGGWELPADFGDLQGEHRALAEGAGLCDLSSRSRIRVSGRDRRRFLQGMLTNDIEAQRPGEGCRALFLSDRGHILADLRVYALAESLLLDVDPAAAPGLLRGLGKYIIADDVELAEEGGMALLSLQGPGSARVLSALLGESGALPGRAHEHTEVPWSGTAIRLFREDRTGAPGYDLSVTGGRAEELWRALRPAGARPVGQEALNVRRLEAGIPWYGIDMDETTLALEIQLRDAISSTKGCYVGQEIVARTLSRGQVRRLLMGLRCEGQEVPAPGDPVRVGGVEVGRVTSAAFSPALGAPIALAYVRREQADLGTALEIVGACGSLRARVAPLLFIEPSPNRPRH